ncbi:Uncharacterized protein dnl_19930 [Desulfonema limicola]|uniref:Uncharacterized protein n=1 Tax=Desulfonema limicola TaxID=45656 RepID=A0A975B6L1_9BACT|nr:hypothetical protein [Desulfonema limicola]QTA79716.1 Uncharacterized protein dnl_19930 [Desulfonema limicola]
MIQWHRLFGITLTDFFTGTAYNVELEKDLSIKQQLLDVLVIEKHEGKVPEQIPDGLENMGKHNLMTYKSHQQALDAWTLDELTGHYVNYRKLISPSHDRLVLPEDFRLYGVSARYPENLKKHADLKLLGEGVYEIKWGSRTVRIIVLSRIPKKKKNAVWNLFSAVPETVKFGFSEYQWRTEVSSVMNEMLLKYKAEGVIAMPYTVKDFQREYVLEHIHKIPADEVLKNFSADDRLKGINSNELSELIKKRFSKKEQKEILEMLQGL